MHGHDAHRVDAAFHVALDRALHRLEIGEKAGERRRRLRLMDKGEAKKLVDRVRRLWSKPRLKRAPAAILAKKARIEGEGAFRRARAPGVEGLPGL